MFNFLLAIDITYQCLNIYIDAKRPNLHHTDMYVFSRL
jgi:hypothetical protein